MMSRHDWARLACRGLGIWAFVEAVSRIDTLVAGLWAIFASKERTQDFPVALGLIYILPMLLTLGLAFLLWFKADWLANRILPGQLESAGDSRIELPGAECLAFSILGIFVLTTGLKSAITKIGSLLTYDQITNQRLVVADARWCVQLLAYLVEISIGALLIFQPSGVAYLLRRIRTAGLQKNSDPADESSPPQAPSPKNQ